MNLTYLFIIILEVESNHQNYVNYYHLDVWFTVKLQLAVIYLYYNIITNLWVTLSSWYKYTVVTYTKLVKLVIYNDFDCIKSKKYFLYY